MSGAATTPTALLAAGALAGAAALAPAAAAAADPATPPPSPSPAEIAAPPGPPIERPEIAVRHEIAEGCLPRRPLEGVLTLHVGVRMCDRRGFGQVFLAAVTARGAVFAAKEGERTEAPLYRYTEFAVDGVTYGLTLTAVPKRAESGRLAEIEAEIR